ncbi:MAG: hypothetical protein ACKO04_00445, partial [Actinomycetes bacterium]
MRSTPRTAVPCTVPVLRPRWVTFLWSRTGPPTDDARRSELDADWATFGLRGAVVLHPASILPASGIRDDVVCQDERLTANVLCRNREGLLHSSFELTDLYFRPADLGWCTDDPRLVQLV